MTPAVRAMIKADQRGSEPFDVLKGIPTSESLYGNVFALDYLFKNQFVQMTGTCTYTVVVETTWTLTWTEEGEDEETPPTPMTDTEVVPSSYTVVRPYSYWTIAGLSVYNIEEAILENYAFFGEQITINPSGYTPLILPQKRREISTRRHCLRRCKGRLNPRTVRTAGRTRIH